MAFFHNKSHRLDGKLFCEKFFQFPMTLIKCHYLLKLSTGSVLDIIYLFKNWSKFQSPKMMMSWIYKLSKNSVQLKKCLGRCLIFWIEDDGNTKFHWWGFLFLFRRHVLSLMWIQWIITWIYTQCVTYTHFRHVFNPLMAQNMECEKCFHLWLTVFWVLNETLSINRMFSPLFSYPIYCNMWLSL